MSLYAINSSIFCGCYSVGLLGVTNGQSNNSAKETRESFIVQRDMLRSKRCLSTTVTASRLDRARQKMISSVAHDILDIPRSKTRTSLGVNY